MARLGVSEGGFGGMDGNLWSSPGGGGPVDGGPIDTEAIRATLNPAASDAPTRAAFDLLDEIDRLRSDPNWITVKVSEVAGLRAERDELRAENERLRRANATMRQSEIDELTAEVDRQSARADAAESKLEGVEAYYEREHELRMAAEAAIARVRALYTAADRQIREQIEAEIRSMRERVTLGDHWVVAYRAGLHDAANLVARGQSDWPGPQTGADGTPTEHLIERHELVELLTRTHHATVAEMMVDEIWPLIVERLRVAERDHERVAAVGALLAEWNRNDEPGVQAVRNAVALGQVDTAAPPPEPRKLADLNKAGEIRWQREIFTGPVEESQP